MKVIEHIPINPPVEKRKHPRRPVTIQGIFSSGPIRGEEGIVLDLSHEGCRIFSSTAPAPASKIELQIRPRQGPSVFIPDAVVQWTSQSAFGVQFKTVSGFESRGLVRLLSLAAL
jgi:hypothetical protein